MAVSDPPTHLTGNGATSLLGASVDTASVTFPDNCLAIVRVTTYNSPSVAVSGITSVVSNGNSFTKINEVIGTGSPSERMCTSDWYFNVTTGWTAVVTIDPAGTIASLEVMWSVDYVTGHNTSVPIGDFDGTSQNTSSGIPPGLTLSGTSGDMVLDTVTFFDKNTANFAVDGGQTEQFHYGPSNYNSMGASSKAATSASTAMGWTQSGTDRAYCYSGFVVQQAGAPAADFVPHNIMRPLQPFLAR